MGLAGEQAGCSPWMLGALLLMETVRGILWQCSVLRDDLAFQQWIPCSCFKSGLSFPLCNDVCEQYLLLSS